MQHKFSHKTLQEFKHTIGQSDQIVDFKSTKKIASIGSNAQKNCSIALSSA